MPIGSILSHYQIQRVLGEGGMGIVYSAIDQRDGTIVAIKELKKTIAGDKELQLRFQQEARTMSSLKHINIVEFKEYFAYEKTLYIVMEYVNGKTFDDYIVNMSGPIPEEKAKKFMLQILDAFSYAHKLGIVHRDIKPQNILVTSEQNIKILDFGVAKILSGNSLLQTLYGTKIGTGIYMSPEQVLGHDIDIRSDIYSLGVFLYQLVSGKPPYDISNYSEHEINKKIIEEPLPRVKESYEFASNYIQKVIDRATNKKKELRFNNCDDFIIAINDNIDNSLSYKNYAPKLCITIGRDVGCDIIINNNESKVSRVHAELIVYESKYIYKDKSKNGSTVNGKVIKNKELDIIFGDKIILGDSVLLPWDRVKVLMDTNHNGIQVFSKFNIKVVEKSLILFIIIMILVFIVFIKI